MEVASRGRKPGGNRGGKTPTQQVMTASASADEVLNSPLVQPVNTHGLLASVTSNIASGFVLFDRQERITYANARAEHILGCGIGALADQTASALRQQLLALAAEPQVAEEALARLWTNPDEAVTDLALTHAAIHWLRVRSFPVSEQPGELLGWGMLLDDVTLERASEKVKSEALALAAHELKTPLAVIKGSATTLLANSQRWDAATQREMLQLIDEQVDRLHELVNALLDIWRLDAGMLPMNLAPLLLPDVLVPLVADWQTRTPQHQLALVLPADLPAVMLDRSRFEQVIGHLLENALKYSSGGTVTIAAEVNAGMVDMRVVDQGRGIAQEYLERIFERFFRIADTDDPVSGSGMGLAVAKAMIQAHGGRIWAESAGLGQGAIFHIALPISPPRMAGVSVPTQIRRISGPLALPAENTARPLVRGERKKILIVDADPGMTRYLRTNFEAQQYRALATSDATQAFRLIEREEPDLLLLDAATPGMAGFELLQRLRDFSSIPVIILTAQPGEGECVQALDLGAADYVSKPFSMQELLARVRAVLRRYDQPDERAAQSAIFSCGELTIDFAQRQVWLAGQQIQLSRTEYKLLAVLAQHVGMVLTHELLLEKVWGPGYSREMDFIWVYIRRVRRKIEPDPSQPRYILTVPGVGYKLARL